ncbi:Coenzyme F420 hydrogenase/dehydrogenase, beta subunit C-terminal domain [Chloroflexota bacterium]
MSQVIKGSRELMHEVIESDLCTMCGACTQMCPYIVNYKGRIVYLDTCDLSQGSCFAFCPRTSVDLDQISERVFGTPYQLSELGTVKYITTARSTDQHIRSSAQNGGVVTTLISLALEEGFIDGAVLTYSDENLLPKGRLFKDNPRNIFECAGVNFIASPTLGTFNMTTRGDINKVGVVGTPCQVLALGKMRISPLERMDNKDNIEKLELVIGLFCNWGLAYADFTSFLKDKIELNRIKKFDIPPPPANIFVVYTDSGHIDIPLDEIRKFIRPTCRYCLDMTNEFADISVGAAEGLDGWNTTIIRNDKGKDLFEIAKAKGLIEVASLPEANLIHLKEASLIKKKRAMRNIVDKSGSKKNLLYLKGSVRKNKELLSLLSE